jgi:hypothetical protein
MRPYLKFWPRDYGHPSGRPTPKPKRAKAEKKAKREEGKRECRDGEKVDS